jgi:sec-independent protein translocase protein TatB
MFDIGSGELLLIAVIGLLVLGPQRLPKVAAELGKWVGRARRTATQLRRQLEREIELSELEQPPKPPVPPAPTTPPATADGRPYGEVPDGPGTHAEQTSDEAGAQPEPPPSQDPTIHLIEPTAGGDKIQN